MPNTFRGLLAAGLLALIPTVTPAAAEGDVAKGEKLFKRCAACHAVTADGASKAGPNLHDIVGRTSGTLEGFKYSDAMVKLGAEGHVWTLEELNKFVENPKQLVPGTKMAFPGLKKPEDRSDVVAYLASLSQAPAEAAAPAEPAPSN